MDNITDRISMDGKVAVVTGAGRGMGRSIAWALAQVGASVVVAERDEETGPATTRALNEAGHKAIWVKVDVRKSDEVDALIAATLDEYGRLDTMINNAGGVFFKPALELSENAFRTLVDENLTSVWLCSTAAAKAMQKGGHGGSIVSTSSMSALQGAVNHAPYGAAKAGIIGLTKALAAEWGRIGIRVNAVAPGPIATEGSVQTGAGPGATDRPDLPLGRMGNPDEVAAAILFLASGMGSYITGETIVVDGGATIV